MQTTTTIQTLEALPTEISADTEVAIPGYYLAHGRRHDRWLLRRTADDKAVRIVRVRW